MKRYEQFNEMAKEDHSPEEQAFAAVVTEIMNNNTDNLTEETLNNYTRKFKAMFEWLKEEVQHDQKD